jgi:hypothetical protein
LVNGTVTSDAISTGAVTANAISANAVTADKINVTSLSAVTGVIGTFSSATSGARLVLEDDRILVYDSSNNVRVKIGRLT